MFQKVYLSVQIYLFSDVFFIPFQSHSVQLYSHFDLFTHLFISVSLLIVSHQTHLHHQFIDLNLYIHLCIYSWSPSLSHFFFHHCLVKSGIYWPCHFELISSVKKKKGSFCLFLSTTHEFVGENASHFYTWRINSQNDGAKQTYFFFSTNILSCWDKVCWSIPLIPWWIILQCLFFIDQKKKKWFSENKLTTMAFGLSSIT